MATWKIMQNPKSEHKIVVADMKAMKFSEITVLLNNAPRDPSRLAMAIRAAIKHLGVAWNGEVKETISKSGFYSLPAEVFVALGEYSVDGKFWERNPKLEKVCDDLGITLPKHKRNADDPDDEPDDAE